LQEWYEGAKASLPAEAQELIAKTLARKRMQDKYIGQIFELYEDFHVVLMPLLNGEVRGSAALERFSKLLVDPDAPYPEGM
jgi:arsenite-transporting ATPase